MRRRQLLLIILIVFIFILPGCWDYNEYENMALVSAIGIDMDEQTRQVTVSIQYMIPRVSSGGGGDGGGRSKTSSSSVAIQKASGLTIADAFTKIQQVTGKRLFFGYMEVQIIGEDAAKNIMGDIMGLNDRTPDIRATAYVLIASGKAADAISTVEPDIPVPGGKHIRELVGASNSTGTAYPVIIEDFVERMQEEGIETTAPRIITTLSKTQDGKGKSDDSAGGGQDSGGKLKQEEGYHKVNGMAVFKHGNFVGWLEGKESMGLSWVTGKNMTPYENFKVSDGIDTQDTIIYRISKSKGKIKIKLDNGEPVVNISIYAEANLIKYLKTTELTTLKPDVINILQEDLESKIRSDIEASIQKCQKEFKSDVFGFGRAFYRQHLSLWRKTYEKNWDDIFPDLPVNIKVQAKIINTGTNIMKFIPR